MAKTTLTKKNLEILYNMACKMPPFNRLPMPKSDKVKFRVIKNPTIYGCFDEVDMAIEISSEGYAGDGTICFFGGWGTGRVMGAITLHMV
jgi:hypothetical protein